MWGRSASPRLTWQVRGTVLVPGPQLGSLGPCAPVSEEQPPEAGAWEPGRELPGAGSSSGEEGVQRARGHTVAVARLQRQHSAPAPRALGPDGSSPARAGGTQHSEPGPGRGRGGGRPWDSGPRRECAFTQAYCVGARRARSSLFLFPQIRKYLLGVRPFLQRPAQGPDQLLPVQFVAQLPPLTRLDVGTQ